jgi:hypothetical protein
MLYFKCIMQPALFEGPEGNHKKTQGSQVWCVIHPI